MLEQLHQAGTEAVPLAIPLVASRKKSGGDAEWDDPDALVEDEIDEIDVDDEEEEFDDEDEEFDDEEFDDEDEEFEEEEEDDFDRERSLDEYEEEELEDEEEEDWES